jgi:phage-related protein
MQRCQIWPKVLSVARAIGIAKVPVPQQPKPVRWLGDSQDRLRDFPEDGKDEVGTALMWAQMGEKHAIAKPMRGFGGASVLEIIEDYAGDTYRAVYTVRFKARIYVLHCFQKKSKKGNETPKHDVKLIEERLEQAKKLEEQATEKVKS